MKTKASSFADPADIAAFRRCKRQGKSDKECFKVGDNGIGCWGDDTTANVPMCALPPEVMVEKFGRLDKARGKIVVVTVRGRSVRCVVADRMPPMNSPYRKNRAGIDLNEAACKALGLTPPIMVPCEWKWFSSSSSSAPSPASSPAEEERGHAAD